MNVPEIFEAMPSCYQPGKATRETTLYFSVGDHRYTVRITPDECEVAPGKTTENADVVLKTTPDLFEKMLIRGESPGAFDVMRGRVKTNDPGALKRLREYFDFSRIR